MQHAPEEIDPSPSQSSQKGEGPLSRLHFGSLNTIPFQPKIQPCQRYLTFLPYEWKSNPVLSFLHKNQPLIYITLTLRNLLHISLGSRPHTTTTIHLNSNCRPLNHLATGISSHTVPIATRFSKSFNRIKY